MVRLPTPGSDQGQWGQILNDYLSVEHNADGTLKKAADIVAKYEKPSTGIPVSDLGAAVQASLTNADNAVHVLNAPLYDRRVPRWDQNSGRFIWSDPVAISVKDFGANGDGVTDDGAAIQAAIDASPVGGTVMFPQGVYLVSSRIKLRAQRTYRGSWPGGDNIGVNGSVIKAANGSNFVGGVVVSSEWANNSAYGEGLNIFDLGVDGNRANNTGSAAGILLMNQQCLLSNVWVRNCNGDGIAWTNIKSDSSVMTVNHVENRVERCHIYNVGGAGIRTIDTGGRYTDGFITDTIIRGAGSHGIQIERSAGWRISGNHLYTIAGHGIYVQFPNAVRVSDNYVEDFGQGQTTGTWNAIRCESGLGGLACKVYNNQLMLRVYPASITADAIFFDAAASQGNRVLAQINGNDISLNMSTAVRTFITASSTATVSLAGNTQGTGGGNPLNASGANLTLISSGNSWDIVSVTWDPGSCADGAAVSTDVSFANRGLAVGSLVRASFSGITSSGWEIHANVISADSINVVCRNRTGSSVDLPSGVLKVVRIA